jgi:peptidoglycan-associated lipoprotein
MKIYALIIIGSLTLTAAGCASNSVQNTDSEDTGADDANISASSSAYGSGNAAPGQSIDNDANSQLATVVYFEFDRAELSPEYMKLLARHAEQMASADSVRIRLEGHADERGSREYNIGLGERRSQAVRRILMANGVSAEQVSTVSFGEERPAVEGASEQSYAQNRRVEIAYVR